MTRLWSDGEPIRVETDSSGRPTRFEWRSRLYRLQRIQQHWQVDTDWWSEEGRIWRDYLTVTTGDGLLCVIYCDLLTGDWRMEKAYD
jgi:hypothetical protein